MPCMAIDLFCGIGGLTKGLSLAGIDMVIIKGEIKTSEIMSCGYNRNTQKWDVKFNNGKTYSYAYLNVEKLTDPEVLNPNMYRISREGREFFDVNAIYVFRSGSESYWHICFGDGSERDYRRNDLHIIESCLAQSQSSNVFEYIKQIAGLSNLKNEETGEKLLSKKFDKISFVGSDVALASLDVVCHFPLNMLIKNPELLNEQECQYAMNPATHLDFLIYNRIGKKPVLAIEVDGYEYHKEDTVQASRDLLKNHIMELYEIPLLRFMTNGSGEKEKIIEMLDKLVG